MARLTTEQRLRLALRALKLAEGIMEYCGGDKWERECTEKDRAKFNDLMDRITGKRGQT